MAQCQELRRIPAVERILQDPEIRATLERGELPRATVLDSVRHVLGVLRERILAGAGPQADVPALAAESLSLARSRVEPKLVAVVNATGVVLHTNLGRAPLAPEAIAAMARAAGYCNLEYNLEGGRRGNRHDAVEGVLREISGAEAALVVNNNAAAVLLVLTALAKGREVVVSRGELVEIGGAFRVPDVMAQSGAVLREVGTTNKTRLADYESAIGPDTAVLLKVHTSNYRILGFTAEASLAELVELGRGRGLTVVEDLGSGSLVDLSRFGVEPETTVQQAVATGADLVTFSGDKLLGGPQAGILVGRSAAIDACGRHPLMRALRPDKVTLAALEATLALYRDPEAAVRRIPALSMLVETAPEIRSRAEAIAVQLRAGLGPRARIEVREDASEAGGGSLPLAKLSTWVVELRSDDPGVTRIEALLRAHRPPVVARIREDALVLDPRTIRDGEERAVVEAVQAAFSAKENR